MYAVIKTGGKQYRVAKGDKLKVEKLPVEAGSSLDIDDVLMIGDGDNVTIGAPRVDGGKVTATVVSHGRHDKIEKRTGHRQDYTEIEITDISA
jgi:large subunit ribosomal protein L21